MPADDVQPAVSNCCTWLLKDTVVMIEAFTRVEKVNVSRLIRQNLRKWQLLLKFSLKPPILYDAKLSPTMAHSMPLYTCPSDMTKPFSSRSFRSLRRELKILFWTKYLKSCSQHKKASCLWSTFDLLWWKVHSKNFMPPLAWSQWNSNFKRPKDFGSDWNNAFSAILLPSHISSNVSIDWVVRNICCLRACTCCLTDSHWKSDLSIFVISTYWARHSFPDLFCLRHIGTGSM